MTTHHPPISIPDILHGKSVDRERLPCGPRRVQRKRSKGWKMPADTISVCRPGRWGNPFAIGESASKVPMPFRGRIAHDASEAVELYKAMLQQCGLPEGCELSELRGKNLTCWCKISAPCHVDVLLELANNL